MERLSALDLAFLDLETTRAPLHVGWTIRIEGPPPSLSALRRLLESRLDGVPGFRRRIHQPPLGPGDAVWVDDAGFDIARHVHRVTLPVPGGAGELREAAGALLSTPLPLERPLWRLYLVDGLADGGWAVVGQAHHALVDGIAAIEVAMLLFGSAGSPAAPAPASRWTPAPAPSPGRATGAAAATRLRGAAGGMRALVAGVASGQVAGGLRSVAQAVDSLAAPAPATALDRSVTRERRVAFATTSLEGAREAGRRHGATVNDVLLSASALAIGHALRRRGESPPAVKVLVPVSTRDSDATGLGNRISFMAIELPLHQRDPVRVLKLVRSRTAAAKEAGDARPLEALARSADLLPGIARRAVARGAARAAGFNAVVSNVPGPPVELDLLGRRVTAISPMIPLLDGHGLTIGGLSYRDRIHLGVTADAEVVPDVVDVARDLESAFDALRHAAAPVQAPWRAKARTRRDADAQRRAASR